MGAHAEWFDTQFVAVVGEGWAAGDGTVADHAIVVGFDNYAVITGSLDEIDAFADLIKARVAELNDRPGPAAAPDREDAANGIIEAVYSAMDTGAGEESVRDVVEQAIDTWEEAETVKEQQ